MVRSTRTATVLAGLLVALLATLVAGSTTSAREPRPGTTGTITTHPRDSRPNVSESRDFGRRSSRRSHLDGGWRSEPVTTPSTPPFVPPTPRDTWRRRSSTDRGEGLPEAGDPDVRCQHGSLTRGRAACRWSPRTLAPTWSSRSTSGCARPCGARASTRSATPPVVRRLAESVVRAHDERSLTGVVAPVTDVDAMVGELVARVSGFGPLQPFLDDPTVEEIWINDPSRVFVARRGRHELTNLSSPRRRCRSWSSGCSRAAVGASTSPAPSSTRCCPRATGSMSSSKGSAGAGRR